MCGNVSKNAIDELADDPRPTQSKKLDVADMEVPGREVRRVRLDNWRIVYVVYTSSALDQVYDYALDLKNFHETSHQLIVAPVLIATEAPATVVGRVMLHDDRLLHPLCTNATGIADILGRVLTSTRGTRINATTWSAGRYYPKRLA